MDQVLESVEVRIIDQKKKSSFRVRRLSNFPVVETLRDFRAALLKAMPDLLLNEEDKEVEFAIGYIFQRNKKYAITTAKELVDGYAAAMDGFCFWADPHDYPLPTARESKSPTAAGTCGPSQYTRQDT